MSKKLKELKKIYFVDIKFYIEWPKNKDKIGTQIHFTITSKNTSKIKLALAVEKVHSEIKEIFNNSIEIMNDECSKYLSQFMFKKIGDIEIGLRCILKKILISVFGGDWKSKIFDDNFRQRNKVKELESLTLEQLHFIIFVSKRFLPIYNDKILEEKSKEELILIIKEQKILTFWELFFPKIKLKEKISEIIKYRNKTMHFKGVAYSDYDKFKKLTKNIGLSIKKANEELEMESMLTMIVAELRKINFSAIKSILVSTITEAMKLFSNINSEEN